MPDPSARRLRRLAEELEDSGVGIGGTAGFPPMLLEEVDRALHPPVHERRVVTSGAVLDPRADPGSWRSATQLDITRLSLGEQPLPAARRFADGLSSWLLLRSNGANEWMVFDRPAGSERDLVVLAGALGATIVQRHPAGPVRVVGEFGVLRWDGLGWLHEPPVDSWIGAVTGSPFRGDPSVVEAMLEFAVHDLGSMGIGSLLVYRPGGEPAPAVEEAYPTPPPLQVTRASHLAPLRHALAQVDGAAVFDCDGILRQLGVRLVPSRDAERDVERFGGTRHTSGRRYSYDDPLATVIAVSEDGPVTVLRGGEVLGGSRPRR